MSWAPLCPLFLVLYPELNGLAQWEFFVTVGGGAGGRVVWRVVVIGTE